MNLDLSHAALSEIWFGILGVLLTGYAVLDGFDLGVGILHPFVARNDNERRLSMNSIGPLWDGNEVWLVVFGGAMFAMFPPVYAAIFSGFYSAFMLLLAALIFRAVSFDFRGKVTARAWRQFWDFGFFLGSALATFLFGVAIGNVVRGIALTESGDFREGLLAQLNPFSCLVGCLALALFAMHGAIYLYVKTEGEFQERIHDFIWRAFGIFLVLYVLTTMFALAAERHVLDNFGAHPWLWIIPIANVLALANVPRAIYYRRPAAAFLSSAVCIASLVALVGATLYPEIVIDTLNPAHSLAIVDSSSSVRTLKIGLLFVLIGMPFVLAYSALVYWTFRGKVKLELTSY